MIKEIKDFNNLKKGIIEGFRYKMNKVNQLLQEKGLDNRINQIIDVKENLNDLIICSKLGYTDSSEYMEVLLCYEDEGIKLKGFCCKELEWSLYLSDLLYFDYDSLFENLDFELDNIIENANKGQLYINYK